MGLSVVEADVGADEQVLHRAGDQHLTVAGQAAIRAAMWTANPPRSASRTSTSPVWTPARIWSGSDPIASTMARAHRTAAIGRSKDAKKPSPVVATSRPPKRASSPRPSWWVLVEQVATAPVAQLGGQRGRVHDVGEQQRRQHPIRVGPGAGAGEELLELVHQAVDAFGERQMVGARQLDEPRALDRGRGHAGLLHGHDRVACPVEHQGRCPDQGQTSATSAFIV